MNSGSSACMCSQGHSVVTISAASWYQKSRDGFMSIFAPVCLTTMTQSMQFQATLSTPSSNHLIEMWPGANELFSTLVKGFIQSMRLACSAQNPLGSEIERAYMSRYLASSAKARFDHSAGTS